MEDACGDAGWVGAFFGLSIVFEACGQMWTFEEREEGRLGLTTRARGCFRLLRGDAFPTRTS
eukprot:3500598-Pleurochrysis_carterae.AAC.1